MTDSTVEVIDCLACSNKVSVLAEKCPSCGNPVKWTHPKILEFINMKDSGFCDKEFNFEYKAYSISGETAPELSVIEKIFAVVGFISFIIFCTTLPFFIALISGGIIGLSYAFYKMKLSNKYTFEADLLSGKWESTNDKLFSKVRDFLLN